MQRKTGFPISKYAFHRKHAFKYAALRNKSMECNIDQKGRLARLYTGIAAIVFGIALALLTYLSVIPATLGWLAVAGSIFGGAFAIFEARKGWCIVRAVGIKTPL
tara:strand:+ start:509 stop:823 length:315 start_codon:yes stop_codon:yes gene_type:complete